MIVQALTVDHFARLRVQAAQRDNVQLLHDPAYQAALCGEHSFAAVAADGSTAAVAGVVDLGGGRALAWSWLSEGLAHEFIAVHNAVRRFLDAAPFHRVEMHVTPGNQQAVRWARLLGFEFESQMHHYYADGRAAYLFARIN